MTETSVRHNHWISRCFDLARRGIGHVSPNPPVGAVIVHRQEIIGEGFHGYFGGPHAEVEAFKSVIPANRHLIPQATLYVSLEPCCIVGKTPPCTDLILREGVREVRIATQDPNPDVAGKGIQVLRENGIDVTCGILEDEALDLISPFRTNILHRRPYVILKWVQSQRGYIGRQDKKIWLSHPDTSIWTHKQRSMADAILVGSRTVMLDDPLLTTREYPGRSPHRVIYDPNGRLNIAFRVFNNDQCDVYYFSEKENSSVRADYVKRFILPKDKSHVEQILSILYDHQVGILMVEGGAYTHQLFIDQNRWDEACVIQTVHALNEGTKAPGVRGKLLSKILSGTDTVINILNRE